MFSDLVGSTALSARMDPEDLREAILVYQKCVAETVQRFGGFVAKSALAALQWSLPAMLGHFPKLNQSPPSQAS
jgi:class 3 adenylate cyclase